MTDGEHGLVDFRTEPARYKHWKLSFDGPVATLAMDVRVDGGLRPGYELKLNSYDLGVDIELYDAVQRLRFEHPEVGAVVITSGKERIFCAGANIRMLSQSSHGWKVNFCKFTNETRNAIEEATGESRQVYLTAVNGPCAGGGYELALATDWIIMADDGNTAVSLPEVPLLAVLPGTGGLTRLVDKRRVRRDRADVFCTTEEGVKGQRAVEWGLVDEVVPRSRLAEVVSQRARELAARTDRRANARGLRLPPPERTIAGDAIRYSQVACALDRQRGIAEITVTAPTAPPPNDAEGVRAQGSTFWALALARELDDLVLHLRTNEAEAGLWVFKTAGRADRIEAYDRLLVNQRDDWLVREIRLYLKRTLKRLDVTSRSMVALVEPGSCFAGTLLELVLAADRSYMLAGARPGDAREQDLRPAVGVAELDLPAPERGRSEGRARGVWHGRAERVRPQESVMAGVDYTERIPNNVNLGENRRLQRALEEWQPKFLEWWRDMGPHGSQANDVYLRTAVSVDPQGWAQFGYLKMPDYRWGIFLAEPEPARAIPFGDHKGRPVWQDVPGEYRGVLRRLIVTQGDTEPASVEQQRHLGRTCPSLYDLRNLFQVNVEEGRHLWAMVYLLDAYFGRDGG